MVSWRRHWKFHVFFTTSILMRSALFWDITQCGVAIRYRRFVTIHPSHLQSSRSQRIFHCNIILRFFPQEVFVSKFFISYIQKRPHMYSPLQPTLWNTILLEKLRVVHILEIFLASYATRRYLSEFQTANCSSLFWAWLIQSSPSLLNINFEGMLRSVDWLIGTGISKDFTAFIFRVHSPWIIWPFNWRHRKSPKRR
jgi:hypothetical protein